MSERIIFCAHSGVRIRPASHTEQPRRDAVRPSAPPTPAEILAAAAYSPRRSSNANSLCGAVSAKSSKVMARIQWILFLTDSGVRVLHAQPASYVSPRRDLHGCRKPRHSGRLGGVGGVSGPGFTRYRALHERLSDAGLCSVNFNIRT